MFFVLSGKSGVYVTLKGKSMIESVDSKLPRVTGVSLPKIRKSRDTMEELMFANQPPPTPVDGSIAGHDRHRLETTSIDTRAIEQIVENVKAEEAENDNPEHAVKLKEKVNNVRTEDENVKNTNVVREEVISEVVIMENKLSDRKSLEIGPVKKVNFIDQQVLPAVRGQEKVEEVEVVPQKEEQVENGTEDDVNYADNVNDNVKFFVTEEGTDSPRKAGVDTSLEPNKAAPVEELVVENGHQNGEPETNEIENDIADESDNKTVTVDDVIKVEISESEQKKSEVSNANTEDDNKQQPVTSEDYPFGEEKDE